MAKIKLNATNSYLPALPKLQVWLELSPPLESNLSQLPELVAGIDEVGRGALFGPVVAAAVILPACALPKLIASNIKDSKKLSSCRRIQTGRANL